MISNFRLLSTLTCVIAISASALAADAAKGLVAQLKELATKADESKMDTVLVVVRMDARSRPSPATPGVLAELRSRVESQLKQAGLKLADGDAANRMAQEKPSRRFPQAAEVAKFRTVSTFDAAVVVDYRLVKPDRATIRLVLLDDIERLFTATVTVPADVLVAGARRMPARNQGGRTQGANLNATQLAGLGALVQAAQKRGLAGKPNAGTPRAAGKSDGKAASSADGQTRTTKNSNEAATTNKPGAAGEKKDVDPKDAEKAVANNPDIGRLNKKVVQYCVKNLGNKVGNGECWTLANEALKYAGAKPAVWYTFGREIGLGEVVPGDILQFESARFEDANSYAIMGTPNHTVVVYSVVGKDIYILHQNFGQKIVTSYKINFDQMTQGKAWAYRPVKR